MAQFLKTVWPRMYSVSGPIHPPYALFYSYPDLQWPINLHNILSCHIFMNNVSHMLLTIIINQYRVVGKMAIQMWDQVLFQNFTIESPCDILCNMYYVLSDSISVYLEQFDLELHINIKSKKLYLVINFWS